MKLWYNQSDQHIRNLLVSLARVLRFALTKIFEKKSVSQSTWNPLKRIEMQKKKNYPFDRLRASRYEILIQSIGPKFQHFHQVSSKSNS